MAGGFRSRSNKGGSEPQRTPDGRKRPAQANDKRAPQRPRRQRRDTEGIVGAGTQLGVDKPRLVAYETLQRVNQDDAFANLVLPKALRQHRVEGRDAAFATELTYGALRNEGLVDAVIAECSSRALEEMSPEVLSALRLGAYQVLFTRVEDHAAVDTTVRLVEAAGHTGAKGFANAIMRSITRKQPKDWIAQLRPGGEDKVGQLAFEHSHPLWVAESFARALGLKADAAESDDAAVATAELDAALAADSARPIVHLVARPGELSAEELALMIGAEEGRYSPYAVYLESGDPAALDPVRQGLAGVQDEGSQLIARAVTEAPLEGSDGGRWLDLCAGPGGKAALLGALARIDGATVDAVEVSAHRAELIRRVVDGLPVKVHEADGRTPGLQPGFDRVLVDAPCSGLGALRRRPEARWRKKEGDIVELSALQYELLSSAINLVRPGGVVVYSTCSPDVRETRDIVERALRELDVTELDARETIPDMGDVGQHKSVQMWPHRHGTDAMFFSVLRRNGGAGNPDSAH